MMSRSSQLSTGVAVLLLIAGALLAFRREASGSNPVDVTFISGRNGAIDRDAARATYSKPSGQGTHPLVNAAKLETFLKAKGRTGANLAAVSWIANLFRVDEAAKRYYEELHTLVDDPVSLAFFANCSRHEVSAARRLCELESTNAYAILLECHATFGSHESISAEAFCKRLQLSAQAPDYQTHGNSVEMATRDAWRFLGADSREAWRHAYVVRMQYEAGDLNMMHLSEGINAFLKAERDPLEGQLIVDAVLHLTSMAGPSTEERYRWWKVLKDTRYDQPEYEEARRQLWKQVGRERMFRAAVELATEEQLAGLESNSLEKGAEEARNVLVRDMEAQAPEELRRRHAELLPYQGGGMMPDPPVE